MARPARRPRLPGWTMRRPQRRHW